MRFRLITYNIHKGIGGVDRLYRPERIVETLAWVDSDIIFLQEVDDGVPRSGSHRQVDLLGDALKMRYRAYQRNVRLFKGHYGNAILSRFPLAEIRHLDLTVPLKKRRQALVARCSIGREDQPMLLLFNCHLGLAGFERSMQLRRILESELINQANNSTPIIVAGDYNDVWGTLGKRWMEPAGFKGGWKTAKTFPAILPVRPLDRIYFRGKLKFLESFVARSWVAAQASDHLPLVADFEI